MSCSKDSHPTMISNDQTEKTVAPHDEILVPDYPEGGLRAWLVVTGSFSALFSTWGVVNSYVARDSLFSIQLIDSQGVFQAEYTLHQLADYSSSTISLIGAIQLFILYGLGPIVGRLFDVVGTQTLIPTGSMIVVISLILLSVCQNNQAYQFFLVQGILFGLGSAVVFTPSLAVVSHWFHRRRAFVMGIVASGSSAGGVVYPILLKRLIAQIGFAWAVRATALLTLACLTLSWLCMRTRLPLSHKVDLRKSVDFTGFKNVNYCLFTLSAFLISYALFIPYFYIEAYANFKNVPPNLASYLVSILNASGVFRIIPGLVADRIGPLNVLIPCMLLSVVVTLGMWLPANGSALITVFCTMYGVLSGAFLSVLPAYIASISSSHNFGGRLGATYISVAVACLVGTPTAGAFDRKGREPQFTGLIVFTGLLILAASVPLIATRIIHSRRLYIKV